MSIPGRRSAQAIALALLVALGWLGGCSDLGPGDPPPPLQGLIVSDPIQTASLAADARMASPPAETAGNELVYVSLPPGAVPTGRTAAIRRVGDAGSIVTTVRNGGFDPLQIAAQHGDSVDILVRDAGSGIVFQVRAAVAATSGVVAGRPEDRVHVFARRELGDL